MAKKETPKKPRAKEYEPKVAVKGTLEDIIKASVISNKKIKE